MNVNYNLNAGPGSGLAGAFGDKNGGGSGRGLPGARLGDGSGRGLTGTSLSDGSGRGLTGTSLGEGSGRGLSGARRALAVLICQLPFCFCLATTALLLQWADLMRSRAVVDDAVPPSLLQYIHPVALAFLILAYAASVGLAAASIRSGLQGSAPDRKKTGQSGDCSGTGLGGDCQETSPGETFHEPAHGERM